MAQNRSKTSATIRAIQQASLSEHDEMMRCRNCGSTGCPRGERPCARPRTGYDEMSAPCVIRPDKVPKTWEQPQEAERERRIRSIMFLWLVSQQDAMLHGLLIMLLQAPTWDPEAVAMWAALMQTGEKELMLQRISERMQFQPLPPMIIPAKCPACAANLNEHIDMSQFKKAGEA